MSNDNNETPTITTEEKARQEIISFAFMRRHNRDFFPSPQNSAILGTWIVQHTDGAWTLENLDAAFSACRDRLESAPQEQPQTPAPQKESFAWGERLTRKSLARMSREDYREHYSDPEFRKQIEDLNQRSDTQ